MNMRNYQILYWDKYYSKRTVLLLLFYISKWQYGWIFHNKHSSYPNYGNNEDTSLVKVWSDCFFLKKNPTFLNIIFYRI